MGRLAYANSTARLNTARVNTPAPTRPVEEPGTRPFSVGHCCTRSRPATSTNSPTATALGIIQPRTNRAKPPDKERKRSVTVVSSNRAAVSQAWVAWALAVAAEATGGGPAASAEEALLGACSRLQLSQWRFM